MQPQGTALLHNAAALIDAYSQEEWPADCGEEWTVEHIEAALCWGPHPLADAEYEMKSRHYETKKKVINWYAKVIRYGELKKNLP